MSDYYTRHYGKPEPQGPAQPERPEMPLVNPTENYIPRETPPPMPEKILVPVPAQQPTWTYPDRWLLTLAIIPLWVMVIALFVR